VTGSCRAIWLALALLAACHHGVDGAAATSWLQTRGGTASTWEPCLRIGTAMHAACGSDAQCGLDATRRFTYWCYAGRYRGARAAGVDVLALSPCFWSRTNMHGDHVTLPGEPNATLQSWAAQVCARFELPVRACSAELRDVVQSCTEDLTGAGP
jgi:hypothetical protein